MKNVKLIGVIAGIIGAIASVIYIVSIYNKILTAMPLWMIIGSVLLIWLAVIAVFLIVCTVFKKHKA